MSEEKRETPDLRRRDPASPFRGDGRRRPPWLYVPPDELVEAMALGARHVEGDARLLMPDPLPPGLTASDFSRWRTPEAIRTWLTLTAVSVIESEFPSDGPARRRAGAHGPVTGERTDRGRVHLHVPLSERDRVAAIEGVRWDMRTESYYVEDPAHLVHVFPWLTVDAQLREREERARRRLERKILLTKALSLAPAGAPSELPDGMETSYDASP